MAFTALATKAYKDPLTTVWANSIKLNDDYFLTGVVKAFVNFDSSAATLTARQSNNVSSVTDNGVGLFTINFTTGFTTSGYVVLGLAKGAEQLFVSLQLTANPLSSGAASISVVNATPALLDADPVCFVAMGASN